MKYFTVNESDVIMKWVNGTYQVSTILKAIYEFEQQQLLILNPSKQVQILDHPCLVQFKTELTHLAFSII